MPRMLLPVVAAAVIVWVQYFVVFASSEALSEMTTKKLQVFPGTTCRSPSQKIHVDALLPSVSQSPRVPSSDQAKEPNEKAPLLCICALAPG